MLTGEGGIAERGVQDGCGRLQAMLLGEVLLLEAVVVQAAAAGEVLCAGALEQVARWRHEPLCPLAERHVLVD